MCSIQTSTGTTLTCGVVEKMGATELRKGYALRCLFLRRFAGGGGLLEEDMENYLRVD